MKLEATIRSLAAMVADPRPPKTVRGVQVWMAANPPKFTEESAWAYREIDRLQRAFDLAYDWYPDGGPIVFRDWDGTGTEYGDILDLNDCDYETIVHHLIMDNYPRSIPGGDPLEDDEEIL